MKSNKKGAELSLNVIVIAVLVLIVLAVLIFIFSNKIGGFRTSVDSCTDKGGKCSATCTDGPLIQTKDCPSGCCIPVLGTGSP